MDGSKFGPGRGCTKSQTGGPLNVLADDFGTHFYPFYPSTRPENAPPLHLSSPFSSCEWTLGAFDQQHSLRCPAPGPDNPWALLARLTDLLLSPFPLLLLLSQIPF